MRALRAILSASLGFVTIACSTSQWVGEEQLYAVQLRKNAVGCYRLDFTALDSARRLGVSSIYTSTLRLHPGLNTKAPFGFRAVSGWPHVASDSMRHIEAGWGADSLTDSIRLSIGDMYTGISLTLGPTSGDWQGVARYYSDADPPGVHHELGQVHARRISCADTGLVAPAG